MNRLKPILRGTALAVIMSMAMCFPAFAARISFSDPSAEAGSEVTVNMKITASDSETINSSNVMLSYDAQALQFLQGTGATGDAGSIRVVGEAQLHHHRHRGGGRLPECGSLGSQDFPRCAVPGVFPGY